MEITEVKVEKFGAIVTVALSWRKEGRMGDWRVVSVGLIFAENGGFCLDECQRWVCVSFWVSFSFVCTTVGVETTIALK